MFFTLVISSNVDITPSVPMPLCFQPPNGISNDLKKLAPFITAPPDSIALAILKARFWSDENTQLERPNIELLAIYIASSSLSKPMIGTTGPKISISFATSAVLGTSTITVGS